jgi:cellobiose transport system substrate-binding protein
MLKRRFRVTNLVLAMIAALLVGTAAPQTAQAVDCTTTIKIWSFGDVFLPRLILAYKQQNPGVCFDIKKSDLDPLNGTNMITACAAANSHTGPDIAAVEIQYSGYWRSYPQCFVDLKTMRRKSDGKSAYDLRSQYLPWRWNNGVAYNGAIIGMPTDVGGLEVAYRWDLLKAKGLPYTRDKVSAAISTWDKFIAFGQKYNAKLKPAEKAAKMGFMDNAGAIYTAMTAQGKMKYYKNNGTSNGQLVYSTNPTVRNAFNTTVKALNAGIGTRVGQFTSDWTVGMQKGKYAVMLAPAWMMDYIKQQAATTTGKWDIANMPGGGGNQGGTQLTIPTSGNPLTRQAAFDFLTWYVAPEQQKTAFLTYGMFPTAVSLYKDAQVTGYKDPFFNNAPVGEIYASGVQKLNPIFAGKYDRAIDKEIGAALTRIDVLISKKKAFNAPAEWKKAMTEIAKVARS